MTTPRSALRHLALGVAFAASVTLSQASAWALGSTPVTVANPTDIAKAQGIQHPFNPLASCTVQNGFSCDANFDLSSSNANQKIVVEYVGGSCNIDQGNGVTRVHFEVFDSTGAFVEQHTVPVPDHFGTSDGSEQILAFGQLVRFYVVPNATIQVSIEAIKVDPTIFTCAMDLSGQAIDP